MNYDRFNLDGRAFASILGVFNSLGPMEIADVSHLLARIDAQRAAYIIDEEIILQELCHGFGIAKGCDEVDDPSPVS